MSLFIFEFRKNVIKKSYIFTSKQFQILPSTNAEELSPLDIKIVGLEKNIQEFQLNIKKTQQFWLRQQGFVVSLSQQRELQLQEINFLQKEVMIMGQKNFKLEYALEMLTKEQANVNKAVISLDQKLSRINSNLMVQKDLKKGLEDKNCIIKNECLLSFQELELELIKLQSDLKYVCTEKVMLKEELNSVLQESLAWNKKVIGNLYYFIIYFFIVIIFMSLRYN